MTRPEAEGAGETDVARLAEACVGCGLCNASCPTYLISGDEREGPRGRIALIADLAAGAVDLTASPELAGHLERCLGCGACQEVCPTGVEYDHLLAHGRGFLRATRRRASLRRQIDRIAGEVVPYPDRLRRYLRLRPLMAAAWRRAARAGGAACAADRGAAAGARCLSGAGDGQDQAGEAGAGHPAARMRGPSAAPLDQ